MGSLSIQKGKRAEREVASLLNVVMDRVCTKLGVDLVKLKRNLKQTQEGGFDLDGLDWIAIEIKHHTTLQINTWWYQTCRQAGPLDAGLTGANAATKFKREPVLIWKKTGGKWQVRMFGRLELEAGKRMRVVTNISWEDFIAWFELKVEIEMAAAIAPVVGLAEDEGLFPTSL